MANSGPNSPVTSSAEYTLLAPVILTAQDPNGVHEQFSIVSTVNAATHQTSTIEGPQLLNALGHTSMADSIASQTATDGYQTVQQQFAATIGSTANLFQHSSGTPPSSLPHLVNYQQETLAGLSALNTNGHTTDNAGGAAILDPYAPYHLSLTPQRTAAETVSETEDAEDEDRCNTANSSDDSRSSTTDPFSPRCKIPLPHPYSPFEFWMEPSFIRRRNERERQRVRNVNDGFERLRNHLPLRPKEREKRLSKVETLRLTIKYIKYLQGLLKGSDSNEAPADDIKENQTRKASSSHTKYS